MTYQSFAERAAELVSRMTFEEKLTQLDHKAEAIPRLGIAAYDYWSEGLHGVARSGDATVFPTAIGLATSWNEELVRRVAAATSDEARAYANEKGKGLSYWSPTINLARDPRWGRAEETYGEDPFLTTRMGAAFVKGLEGTDEETPFLKAIATIKHFAANNSENNRHTGSSDMDERTLREYYTRTFQRIVEETGVHSVMTSYNRLNGVPMSANEKLLRHMLRESWGFTGYVVSDCGAIGDIFRNHKWRPEGYDHPLDADETVGKTIPAGTDLCCGTDYGFHAGPAIEKGYMTEADVDKALVRLFTARMETGEFDDPAAVPYRSPDYSWDNQIGAADHTALAEQAAVEGVVLLKNDRPAGSAAPLLPLDAHKIQHLVIYGEEPLVNGLVLGDYSGTPLAQNTTTPAKGIADVLKAANPAARITLIHPQNTATYFANVRHVTLVDAAGDMATVLTPGDAAGKEDCVNQGNRNFGYVGLNAWIRYDRVPLDGIVTIGVETSGSRAETTQGAFEVHLDAVDGPVITTIVTDATAGWDDYRLFTGTLTQTYTGVHSLYLVAAANAAYAGFTPEQRETIAAADAVIAYVGTRQSDSREDYDRLTLKMARFQSDAVAELTALNPRTAVYISAVGQVDIEAFRQQAPSILWCTYNGQAQGQAAGRLLFGETAPSGRLTFTWYADEAELPPINHYALRSGDQYPGRTYQYFTGGVSYPFGHGLGYTEFVYEAMHVSRFTVTPDDTLAVTVTVRNAGKREGVEVIQIYVAPPRARTNERPFKELKGFAKVLLKAGECRDVTVTLPVKDWYVWDDDTARDSYDQGTYVVEAGASSRDIRLRQEVSLEGCLTARLKTVTAEPDRVIVTPCRPCKAHLTAVLSDDSVLTDWSRASVCWNSSHPQVARVDDTGVVTGLTPGVATITATVTMDGRSVSSRFPVVVTD